MIEKLPFTEIHTGGEDMVDRVEFRPVSPYEMQHKINELVDIINWLGQSEPEIQPTNMYDLYVKNRHLIGKLCKFKWGQGCYYGILTNIKRKPTELPFESNGRAFRTCEPVKPDDNIVYKGE